MEAMVVVGFKPWLRWCIGMTLVTLMLVVVGQHEVLTLNRAERLPHVTLPPPDPHFSMLSLADMRLPNPGRGATAPLPLRSVQTAAGSAAVSLDGDGEDRWSVILRPPGSPPS